jgi:predicted HTH domain antitoxin
MHCLPIPDDAFAALKLPPARAEEELRREFAVFLVKEGLLETAQARTVAGMDRVAFQTLLAQRKVAWVGSPEDALDDMQAARAAIRTDPR